MSNNKVYLFGIECYIKEKTRAKKKDMLFRKELNL